MAVASFRCARIAGASGASGASGSNSDGNRCTLSSRRRRVLELTRCEWIERREKVIALGPSDTIVGADLDKMTNGVSQGY